MESCSVHPGLHVACSVFFVASKANRIRAAYICSRCLHLRAVVKQGQGLNPLVFQSVYIRRQRQRYHLTTNIECCSCWGHNEVWCLSVLYILSVGLPFIFSSHLIIACLKSLGSYFRDHVDVIFHWFKDSPAMYFTRPRIHYCGQQCSLYTVHDGF